MHTSHYVSLRYKHTMTRKKTKATSTLLGNITIDRETERDTDITMYRAFLFKQAQPSNFYMELNAQLFQKSTHSTQEQVAWWLLHCSSSHCLLIWKKKTQWRPTVQQIHIQYESTTQTQNKAFAFWMVDMSVIMSSVFGLLSLFLSVESSKNCTHDIFVDLIEKKNTW